MALLEELKETIAEITAVDQAWGRVAREIRETARNFDVGIYDKKIPACHSAVLSGPVGETQEIGRMYIKSLHQMGILKEKQAVSVVPAFHLNTKYTPDPVQRFKELRDMAIHKGAALLIDYPSTIENDDVIAEIFTALENDDLAIIMTDEQAGLEKFIQTQAAVGRKFPLAFIGVDKEKGYIRPDNPGRPAL